MLKQAAVVLHKYSYSESTFILKVLTPEMGLMSLMAKGAKKTKSPFFGQFDASHLLELVISYKEGRELHTLTESSILQNRAHHQQDLMHGALASVIRELVMKILHEGEGSQELFALLNTSLEWLDHQREIEVYQSFRFLGRFVYRLVELMGFEIQTDFCQNCQLNLNYENVQIFDLREGGFVCRQCAGGLDDHEKSHYEKHLWVKNLWQLLVQPKELQADHLDQIEETLFRYLFGHLDQKPNLQSRSYLSQIRQMFT